MQDRNVEKLRFRPLSQGTLTNTATEYVVRLGLGIQNPGTQMATLPNPYLDLPPAESVEEYDRRSYNRATPSAG